MGIVTGLGLTGFAFGFAMKDFVSNAIGGVVLLVYRPFQIGDEVIMLDKKDVVERVDLRYTTLRSDNKKVLVPNANILNNTVEVLEQRQEACKTTG